MNTFVSTNRVLMLRNRSKANRLLEATTCCSPSLKARGNTVSESGAVPPRPSGESAQPAESASSRQGTTRRSDIHPLGGEHRGDTHLITLRRGRRVTVTTLANALRVICLPRHPQTCPYSRS